MTTYQRICKFCESAFSTRRKSQAFCGHRCYGLYRYRQFGNMNKRQKRIAACEICGRSYKARPKQRFCSHYCASIHHSHVIGDIQRKPDKLFRCGVCGITFTRRTKRTRSNHYCSIKCFTKTHPFNEATESLKRKGYYSSPLSGLYVTNVHAKNFHLRSPNGVDYHGRNIAEFVRSHPHLFTTEELRPKPESRCGTSRAAFQLTRLRPKDHARKQLNSWHGWTWISTYERRFDDGLDPIRRQSPFDGAIDNLIQSHYNSQPSR